MQGKILIVDDVSTNRIVLKVKLAAAFYQVLQASTLAEAVQIVEADRPDLVITALDLPDGSAAELCQILHASSYVPSVPILALGNDTDTQTRLDTLRAGAGDVMQRPLNETLLMGRVRAMIRAYHTLVEWQVRDDTSCALDLAEAPAEFFHAEHISFIGLDAAPLKGWTRQMQTQMRANFTVAHLRDAMAGLHGGAPADAVVLALPANAEGIDACLNLIPSLRASAQTRNTALLVIQKTPNPAQATSALDMGADDVMPDGFCAAELGLRLSVLLRRKRQVAQMMQKVRTGLREVGHDPLTGLYNRRYAMPFMARLIERSVNTKVPFAVILADMDHFKRINDMYGHASGDAVLVETARRLRTAVRDTDVIARMGGEEFLIAMPATDVCTARKIADKVCNAIGDTPFAIPGASTAVPITISLGLTQSSLPMQVARPSQKCLDALLDRADKALYAAKMQGRNRVTLSTPQTRPAA